MTQAFELFELENNIAYIKSIVHRFFNTKMINLNLPTVTVLGLSLYLMSFLRNPIGLTHDSKNGELPRKTILPKTSLKSDPKTLFPCQPVVLVTLKRLNLSNVKNS